MSTAGASPGRRAARVPSLTLTSLFALALGVSLGVLGHARGGGGFRTFAAVVGPLGDLWLAALEMAVLPLALLLLLATVVGAARTGAVGALAGRAVLLFTAMLSAGGLLALGMTPLGLRLARPASVAIGAFGARTAVPEAARAAAAGVPRSLGETLGDLLPRNVFDAAARGDLLPLLLFTALFGFAVARLPEARREPLARLFEGLAAAMLQCVRWILVFIPLGVFVFTFRFALGAGSAALGTLGTYVAIISTVMLACTLLLYPFVGLFGRRSVGEFARAAAPAQLVAVTTRSSIASLPALIEAGRDRLRLPDSATGLVLPLSVSVFKLDVAVGNAVKLLFLAQVYGITLGPGAVAAFMANILILSYSSPGLPSGGSYRTVPAYLAAGVPIEGLVIVQAVEAIPDVFMTLLNVTADLAAATVLGRQPRAERAGASAATARPAAEYEAGAAPR